MYTAYIGKRLVEAVNKKEGTKFTPRSFFDERFYPCFFKNERFLLDTNNAPPGQAYKQKGKTPLTAAVIEEQRRKIHTKIDGGDADASIFLGGPSSDPKATTSGQVTALPRSIPPDDVYASWLGTGLGATVEGGLSLLIDDDEALLALYEGWDEYRQYLDQTASLKPHQINTWNGQWLAYRLGREYNPAVSSSWAISKDGTALETQTWVQLLFALSYHYRKTPGKSLTAYVYAFGQMNRTVGFVRLDLPEVYALSDLYNELFAAPTNIPPAVFEDLYKTEFGFKRACQNVSVGLRALQPKDVRVYFDGGKLPTFASGDTSSNISFFIQETWIIAMLNNKDLSLRATELAEALHQSGKSERGKMTGVRRTEDVLASKTRRDFIENLTAVLESDASSVDLFNTIVEEIISMPTDHVPLFLTLVRFKYAYIAKTSGKSNTPSPSV